MNKRGKVVYKDDMTGAVLVQELDSTRTYFIYEEECDIKKLDKLYPGKLLEFEIKEGWEKWIGDYKIFKPKG